MDEPLIRIHVRLMNGEIEDSQQDFSLADFGGVLPSIGDTILDPSVLSGADRRSPENRRLWTVVGRVFNPRDLGGTYVALVVEERQPAPTELALLPR